MERELVRFVGSGIAVIASGLGVALRPDTDGYAIVDHLAAGSGADLHRIVVGCVRDIWRGWRRARLPREVAFEHVIALAPLVVEHQPRPETVLAVVVKATKTQRDRPTLARRLGREGAGDQARRLALLVLDEVERSGALAGSGLNPQLTFFLLERLFQHLLDEHEFLRELKPLLEPFARRIAEAPSSGDDVLARHAGDWSQGQALPVGLAA